MVTEVHYPPSGTDRSPICTPPASGIGRGIESPAERHYAGVFKATSSCVLRGGRQWVRKGSATRRVARLTIPPRLTVCATLRCMADTITFRPDEDAARALDVLTSDGTPVSTAVRAALISAARERARAKLRSEAETLAADERDRAEAAQVLRDMECLRAWLRLPPSGSPQRSGARAGWVPLRRSRPV